MAEYSFRADSRISQWQRELLREFCGALDGDIVQLAGKFGLKVFQEDLLPYERGYLEKSPSHGSSTGWVIKLNVNDTPQTQNFTAAHELGHFLLHSSQLANLDQLDGRVNRNTDGGTDPFSYLDSRDIAMEAEANRFAAVLLMPPNLFKPAFFRLNGDVPALSKLFFVSEGVVERRIKELCLA